MRLECVIYDGWLSGDAWFYGSQVHTDSYSDLLLGYDRAEWGTQTCEWDAHNGWYDGTYMTASAGQIEISKAQFVCNNNNNNENQLINNSFTIQSNLQIINFTARLLAIRSRYHLCWQPPHRRNRNHSSQSSENFVWKQRLPPKNKKQKPSVQCQLNHNKNTNRKREIVFIHPLHCAVTIEYKIKTYWFRDE